MPLHAPKVIRGWDFIENDKKIENRVNFNPA